MIASCRNNRQPDRAGELIPWNTQARTRTPAAGDSWEFVGGDSDWQLRQHRYDFVNGRLAHTDSIPHDTPVPRRAADAGNFPKGFGSSGG